MYFITKLPKNSQRTQCHLGYCVSFDKECYFLAIGVCMSIILDQDGHFTSMFWKTFHEHLCTILHFNAIYDPQPDG